MTYKAVLFDSYNTLIREWKDVSECYTEAIRSSYGIMVDDIDMSKYQDLTVQETVTGILAKNGIGRDEINEKMDLFLQELPYAHYNVAGHDKAQLVDGAKELLQKLHKKGYVIGTATGQMERVLRNMFERAGLNYDSYFKFGSYGDADISMSRIIETAVDVAHNEFTADRQNITFISCSPNSTIAAQSIGINSIGVITGLHSMEELERSGVKNIAKSLKDCERFLK